jgi:hypothetical protein
MPVRRVFWVLLLAGCAAMEDSKGGSSEIANLSLNHIFCLHDAARKLDYRSSDPSPVIKTAVGMCADQYKKLEKARIQEMDPKEKAAYLHASKYQEMQIATAIVMGERWRPN